MAKAKPTEPVVEPTVDTTEETPIVDTITDIPTESVEVSDVVLNVPAPEKEDAGHPSRDFYTAL